MWKIELPYITVRKYWKLRLFLFASYTSNLSNGIWVCVITPPAPPHSYQLSPMKEQLSPLVEWTLPSADLISPSKEPLTKGAAENEPRVPVFVASSKVSPVCPDLSSLSKSLVQNPNKINKKTHVFVITIFSNEWRSTWIKEIETSGKYTMKPHHKSCVLYNNNCSV